jgi:hypothetical protein
MSSMTVEEYTEIEDTLRFHLRPYHPDPGFVNHLKVRLTTTPGVEIEKPPSNISLYVQAAAIVAGFAVFFWMLRRLAGGK